MKYRIREYGPKSGRFFQIEFQEEEKNKWLPIPWAPDFSSLNNATDWLDGLAQPHQPEIIHPYPDETPNKPLS